MRQKACVLRISEGTTEVVLARRYTNECPVTRSSYAALVAGRVIRCCFVFVTANIAWPQHSFHVRCEIHGLRARVPKTGHPSLSESKMHDSGMQWYTAQLLCKDTRHSYRASVQPLPVKTLLTLLFCSLKYITQSSVLVDPVPERTAAKDVQCTFLTRCACLKLSDPSLLFQRRMKCCQRLVV